MDVSACDWAALASGAIAGLGLLQSVAGLGLLARFRRGRPPAKGSLPAITVLKPLYGDEALLEPALASFCAQDYPDFQIVFGVQSAADPALQTVDRLRRRFPGVAIDVVVDPTRHGRNGKVGNLINMFPAARHDMLVIADSDIHAPPDTLRAVAATLARPGVGIATALYTGLPVSRGLAGQFGAAYINHDFLNGALLSRSLGRQDCLGAIMALRRDLLARIGGLEALSEHIADDALLGKLARARGLEVALIDAIPATTVPETQLAALFQHELRWARTIRSVAPFGFAMGAIQFPLFWGLLMLGLAEHTQWAAWALAAMWLLRAGIAALRQRLLRQAWSLPIWCLPLRDALSITVMIASYGSNRVAWRGQEHRVMGFTRAELEPGRG